MGFTIGSIRQTIYPRADSECVQTHVSADTWIDFDSARVHQIKMHQTIRQPETKRAVGNMPGLVIAAIGLQLLLCSVSSAATSTYDRIESSVVHALRDIVDRQIAQEQQVQHFEPGFCLNDTLLKNPNTAPVDVRLSTAQLPGHWLLNLPPPSC